MPTNRQAASAIRPESPGQTPSNEMLAGVIPPWLRGFGAWPIPPRAGRMLLVFNGLPNDIGAEHAGGD